MGKLYREKTARELFRVSLIQHNERPKRGLVTLVPVSLRQLGDKSGAKEKIVKVK